MTAQKIKLTEISTSQIVTYEEVQNYDVTTDPMWLFTKVSVGIQPDGEEKFVTVERTFPKSEFIAEVIS